MKKIPTLFERVFDNGKVVDITDKMTPGCEEAFLKGDATIKYDGSCCAIMKGKFYKRYDAKPGRKIPHGAIPCCDPDPVTGHHPHWVLIDADKPEDKWFVRAYCNALEDGQLQDGTYEAVGKHFNGNPYYWEDDKLVLHGLDKVRVKRDFESIGQYLSAHDIEGLVFWYNNEPVCKIKRKDFGLPWPVV